MAIATAALGATIILAGLANVTTPKTDASPGTPEVAKGIIAGIATAVYLSLMVVAGRTIFPPINHRGKRPKGKRTQASTVYSLFGVQLTALAMVLVINVLFSLLIPWVHDQADPANKATPTEQSAEP